MIQQLGLIGLDGQHVVALLVDDLFGHTFVAADGIDGDDAAFERQHTQQFGMMVISSRPPSQWNWPNTSRFFTAQALTICTAFLPEVLTSHRMSLHHCQKRLITRELLQVSSGNSHCYTK